MVVRSRVRPACIRGKKPVVLFFCLRSCRCMGTYLLRMTGIRVLLLFPAACATDRLVSIKPCTAEIVCPSWSNGSTGDRRRIRHERVPAQLQGRRHDFLEPVLCGLVERRQRQHRQLCRRPVQGGRACTVGVYIHLLQHLSVLV